ncbi:hypothetical protein A1E_01665 [Rickettsia canadensis str. McKiel]|uniref:Uncharacterized protein n=1 Tax=Rickettsia canadensis (strain McKiel) TaxID=293613 RepID=A8EY45_RICCK|nr:hypothetical protein A1E_01665 [Rickettsia canadensis str. McKiel]
MLKISILNWIVSILCSVIAMTKKVDLCGNDIENQAIKTAAV